MNGEVSGAFLFVFVKLEGFLEGFVDVGEVGFDTDFERDGVGRKGVFLGAGFFSERIRRFQESILKIRYIDLKKYILWGPNLN